MTLPVAPHSELVTRALTYVSERMATCAPSPDAVRRVLDEAGMRYNLSPLDAAMLERLWSVAPRTARTSDDKDRTTPCA